MKHFNKKCLSKAYELENYEAIKFVRVVSETIESSIANILDIAELVGEFSKFSMFCIINYTSTNLPRLLLLGKSLFLFSLHILNSTQNSLLLDGGGNLNQFSRKDSLVILIF